MLAYQADIEDHGGATVCHSTVVAGALDGEFCHCLMLGAWVSVSSTSLPVTQEHSRAPCPPHLLEGLKLTRPSDGESRR